MILEVEDDMTATKVAVEPEVGGSVVYYYNVTIIYITSFKRKGLVSMHPDPWE